MELFTMFRQMGLATPYSASSSTFLPFVAAAAYLFRPSERRLAMMRPLFAGPQVFAGLNGTSLGTISALRGLWVVAAVGTIRLRSRLASITGCVST